MYLYLYLYTPAYPDVLESHDYMTMCAMTAVCLQIKRLDIATLQCSSTIVIDVEFAYASSN